MTMNHTTPHERREGILLYCAECGDPIPLETSSTVTAHDSGVYATQHRFENEAIGNKRQLWPINLMVKPCPRCVAQARLQAIKDQGAKLDRIRKILDGMEAERP